MKYHISTQRIIPQNVGGLLQDDKKRGKLFKIQTIQDMGRNECDEASVSCSNFFTIIWVKQGHGSYIADKDKVEIYHNTIYCVKPGQLYSFNPCENTEGYVISFLQNFLCSLYNHPNSLPKCRLFNSILLGVIIPVDAKTRIEMNILVESMIREFSNSDFVSTEIYGERTIKMGEVLNNLDLQHHYYETLTRVYEADHKPELALINYRKFDSLTNVISNAKQNVEQAIQVAKISIDQLAEHNKQEERSFEAIRRNQKRALIAALTAMMTFIALTILAYRNLRLKQKANNIISRQAASLKEQNETIEKALKEKEVLLKETHHRVKNNLQLISSLLELQAENLTDENANKALRTAQRRVLSIASVHSQFYGSNNDETIEFSTFVNKLFMSLNNAFGTEGKTVQFTNSIPTTSFQLNTVMLLGLILNELITNSFKYAFNDSATASINIDLKHAGNMYVMEYYDNGPGLPDGKFNANSDSLGLYLVKRLSKQLKGTATYKYDNGSNFTIIFPDAST